MTGGVPTMQLVEVRAVSGSFMADRALLSQSGQCWRSVANGCCLFPWWVDAIGGLVKCCSVVLNCSEVGYVMLGVVVTVEVL